MQFKFDENKEINAQFVRYKELLERNLSLGNEFTAQERSEYLQMALPSKYKNLLFDYHTLNPEAPFTYTSIKGLITERWERARVIEKEEKERRKEKEKKKEDNSEKALLSHNNKSAPKKKPEGKEKQKEGGKEETVCYNCKKKGHTVFRCRNDLTPEGIEAINKMKRQLREKKKGEKKEEGGKKEGEKKKEREVTCIAIPSLSFGDDGELGIDSEIFATPVFTKVATPVRVQRPSIELRGATASALPQKIGRAHV